MNIFTCVNFVSHFLFSSCLSGNSRKEKIKIGCEKLFFVLSWCFNLKGSYINAPSWVPGQDSRGAFLFTFSGPFFPYYLTQPRALRQLLRNFKGCGPAENAHQFNIFYPFPANSIHGATDSEEKGIEIISKNRRRLHYGKDKAPHTFPWKGQGLGNQK